MDRKNIIVGAASLFIGASGEAAAPAPVVGVSYRTTVDADADWRDIGYTQDGLEVTTDPTYTDVEVDQLLDAAIIFKDGMGLSISTTMAEASLENLLLAWGQEADTLVASGGPAPADEIETLEIQGGGLGDSPIEYGLIAVGNGPRVEATNKYRERRYHAFRVLSVEGAGTMLARSDAATIPVTFRALPEDDGRYGVVVDRVLGTPA